MKFEVEAVKLNLAEEITLKMGRVVNLIANTTSAVCG